MTFDRWEHSVLSSKHLFKQLTNKDRDAAMMKPLPLSLTCLIRVLAHSTGVFALHAARIEE